MWNESRLTLEPGVNDHGTVVFNTSDVVHWLMELLFDDVQAAAEFALEAANSASELLTDELGAWHYGSLWLGGELLQQWLHELHFDLARRVPAGVEVDELDVDQSALLTSLQVTFVCRWA